MVPNDDLGRLRERWIALLSTHPPFREVAARDLWLESLPDAIRNIITRRLSDCRQDLESIFNQVQGQQLEDGRFAPVLLLDYVISRTQGTALANQLQALQQDLEQMLQGPIQEFNAFGPSVTKAPPVEEIIIGQDEKVPVQFLQEALKAARGVARIRVQRTIGGHACGTGWLIAPNLLITNRHVAAARYKGEPAASEEDLLSQARNSLVRFGYDHAQSSYAEYHCTELLAQDTALDYALLRIADTSTDGIPLTEWGLLRIVRAQPTLVQGARLNVIQHPGGRTKQIALRTNFYIGSIGSGLFHYLSDTEEGSSGSPVLNDDWEVVGLHHAWDYYQNHYKGLPFRFNNLGVQYATSPQFTNDRVSTINEGIPIHAILHHLPAPLREEIEHAQGWA